ncbi:MAG: protein translocase subunit SecD [Verrucomicrobiota bacterium]|nr:protein translocase subunit SecD [Verrucomicrobiota bacterium]
MKRNNFWKWALVVFLVAWALWEMNPPTSRDLIQVFKNEAINTDPNFSTIVHRAEDSRKQFPERSYAALKEAAGTNDLKRYFPFVPIKADANSNLAVLNYLQKKAAGKIRLGLDLRGGTSFLVGMDTNNLAANSDKSSVLSQAAEVLRRRVDKLGVAEPLVQPTGSDRILIQLPGVSEADKDTYRNILQRAAFLEFRMVHPNSSELIKQGIVEPGYVVLKQTRKRENGVLETESYLVKKKAERNLTGKYVKSAMVTRSTMSNEPEISFKLDSAGADLFGQITREYQPQGEKFFFLAVVLDGEIYSVARITGPIEGGNVQITGKFTVEEAYQLANTLENPLAAPVKILEERSVDPSLGKDSIRSGVKSAIIGVIAVAGFMAIYYTFAGVIANVALLLNIIILLGVMCSVGTTLTLPGIAGIVLTIGMAVDANVLIFERIREESAKGKSLRGALAAGYDRAFGTIFDSHVTTLISSIILIFMGTGSVKGFGVALTIGVAASLFTALVVTRLIFDLLIEKNVLKKISMLHIIRNPNIDFMKWAKPAFAASWLLIIVGMGYGIFIRGHNVLGVDFAGGDTLTLRFAQRVEVDKLRDTVTQLKVGEPLIQYQKDLSGGAENLKITTEFNSGSKVENELRAKFPEAKFQRIGLERVGASVGKEIQKTAILAAMLAMFGILIYVAFRYEFSFAVGAVVAIIHDILMTLGWFFLVNRQLSAPMVAAILTIIGFSINDTIVIFDRIREDLKLGIKGSFREVINKALNQTLSRTLITSGTVFLATLSLFIFGGGVINDFAFTFLVGIITGTYSSIYIASALVLWWHKGERPRASAPVAMDNAVTARV